MTIFENVKNQRQYKAATGLSKEKFEELANIFTKHFVPKTTIASNYAKSGALQSAEEALFFVLYYLKTGVTMQVLGINFGISDSCAIEHIARNKAYLLASLKELKQIPVGIFSNQEAYEKAFEGVEEIFIDCTEIPVPIAVSKEKQGKYYSGKKKTYR